MSYCRYCGKEIADEAVNCVYCGNAVSKDENEQKDSLELLKHLSLRIKIASAFWFGVGVIQICEFSTIITLIGIFNVISAIYEFHYSDKIITNPQNIVGKFEGITSYIINIIYNTYAAGAIGFVVSLADMIIVRNFVMENKEKIKSFEENF